MHCWMCSQPRSTACSDAYLSGTGKPSRNSRHRWRRRWGTLSRSHHSWRHRWQCLRTRRRTHQSLQFTGGVCVSKSTYQNLPSVADAPALLKNPSGDSQQAMPCAPTFRASACATLARLAARACVAAAATVGHVCVRIHACPSGGIFVVSAQR